jgi:hypothetical protein
MIAFDLSIGGSGGTLKKQVKEEKTNDHKREHGKGAGSSEIKEKEKEDYSRGKQTVRAIHLSLDLEPYQLDLSSHSEGEPEQVEEIPFQYSQRDQR